MKAYNLKQLAEAGLKIPKFIAVTYENYKDECLNFSDADKFAVRSSFNTEDSETEACAGKFLTLLNVDRTKVKEAVVQIHKDYIEKMGVEEASDQDIIIQEMVNAVSSGVMFTANPLGILNEMIIVVGEGLGVNVVDNKVDTTTYHFNRDDRIYYSEQHEKSIELSNENVKSLIALGEAIELILGNGKTYFDIEFAIDADDKLYILQARPITTLKLDNIITLDNSNIIESYPGVSLPLTQSFVKEVYTAIFTSAVYNLTQDNDLVTKLSDTLNNMVEAVNGRMYYYIDNWYKILKLLPFSNKIISIWQEMLGVTNKHVNTNIKFDFDTKFKVLKSVLYYLKHTPSEMDKLGDYFDSNYNIWKKRVKNSKSVKEDLIIYKNLLYGICNKWHITLYNDMYAFIFTWLADKNNISDIKNMESMKPVQKMRELVEIAQIHGIKSPLYIENREAYISEYGDRGAGELKLETHTYRTHPELLDDVVTNSLDKYEYSDNKHTNKNIDFFAKRAKIGIANREKSRLNRAKIYGLIRELMLNIGTRLFNEGLIDNIEDVFYLTLDDLRQREDINLKETIDKHKAEIAIFETYPAISRLVYCNHIERSKFKLASAVSKYGDQALQGEVVSYGRVEAEAIVVDDPMTCGDTKGKIIIAKSTDPGWVFIIQDAVGVITERGSVLSHTAIVTRELDKPSLVNVKGITDIVKTGDIVELDAYNGEVHIKT